MPAIYIIAEVGREFKRAQSVEPWAVHVSGKITTAGLIYGDQHGRMTATLGLALSSEVTSRSTSDV